VPFAPLTDEAAEREALSRVDEIAEVGGGSFAEHLDSVPVLLVVLADLRSLAATDRDLERYTLVGGASIYPFVWSILLAARAIGLAGVSTSMLTRREDDVRAALRVPDHFAVAAGVALGHPVKQPTKLRRAEVSEFATFDYFDGVPVPTPQPGVGP
jgi:nitroreductase